MTTIDSKIAIIGAGECYTFQDIWYRLSDHQLRRRFWSFYLSPSKEEWLQDRHYLRLSAIRCQRLRSQ